MPMNPDDKEDEWQEPGLTIGHDGKLSGHNEVAEMPARPFYDEAPLELAEPQPSPAVVPSELPEEPKPPRKLPVAALGLFGTLLFFAGAVAILLTHKSSRGAVSLEPLPRREERVAPAEPGHVADYASSGAPREADAAYALTIESTPSGASVLIDGEEAGRTPFLGSNGAQRGEAVPLELKLPGYELWTGKIAGGADARLNIKLTPHKR